MEPEAIQSFHGVEKLWLPGAYQESKEILLLKYCKVCLDHPKQREL